MYEPLESTRVSCVNAASSRSTMVVPVTTQPPSLLTSQVLPRLVSPIFVALFREMS
ncbi:MAG: hypothetical protein V9G12_19975 [Microthrixaceae bacterium]